MTMKSTANSLVAVLLTMMAHLVYPVKATAHEPLFGLGPHTVGQYAWALESEFERSHGVWANHFELIYGITPDIAVTAALPYVFDNEGGKAGFADLGIRGKFRFYRRDYLNGSDAFALHWGIKFSNGNRLENRGSGTTDYIAGLSFGRESRKHYAFADLRYQLNGSLENLERGNALNLNVAYGIRPLQLEYLQPDLVLLIEMLGVVTGSNSLSGTKDPNSGGSSISIAPGFLFSYRNVMIKGGVKFAVLESLNGNQEKPDAELILGIEFHMPPFK